MPVLSEGIQKRKESLLFMKKTGKLTALLSAAAVLTLGASATSFAAGWEKDDSGIWHYYDSDGELVTGEWRKDGSNWFYLDDEGDMLRMSWVDDDSFVNEKGVRLVNSWIKVPGSDSEDDPESGDDSWYFFDKKGVKLTDTSKKINGKTYYFDEDGKMITGWYEKNGEVFYLGDENDGVRKDNQWLWLERPGNSDEDSNEAADALGCSDDNDDICDDEGWYWFGAGGKLARDTDKKKINGRYYYFNEHGQMLYEGINDRKVSGAVPASQVHAAADGNAATPGLAQAGHMIYANQVENGWRADGWYEITGSEDTDTDDDSYWYYFKDGKAKRADSDKDTRVKDDDGNVYVKRYKIDSSKGKLNFAFDEYGRTQTGLQYVPDDNAFYYFDENGWPKTGRVSNVECDDDVYEFYFNTSSGKNGQGVNGEKSGYLYFNGKKLAADDDNRLFFCNDKIYLVNSKGKIQKSKNSKKYDIENHSIDESKVEVAFNSDGSVKSITLDEGNGTAYTANELLQMSLNLDSTTGDYVDEDGKYEDTYVTIPSIELYDGDVYTYRFRTKTAEENSLVSTEMWYDVHEKLANRWK